MAWVNAVVLLTLRRRGLLNYSALTEVVELSKETIER